ncbi:MAG: 23S rRNA (guanosine(2251)-2'-O)-methyltransferase RlmB [Gammaproteobacteria bacterium]|nr:23S rRNA (guanosine(2251)-2'-O)-methyltransferase RlmB [Gammaproteobacteria bacterium]NIR84745.1 23S rRNA (guanosine(2251)-2'-O)-methyltransferase RlmB [Gammaproteobacteria bacterium]NIR91241.1 23S rRNA (guanosine(2251)-2'-O)-methyltransferase RlmB [Gammaproteobacteria bacterium]NIU05788.1 23S rRNA (guanosine(2251)-2'-O)-methyltransferase RlmB [Gammaproteobacteria bacterium]NIV52907.1 23S rRNA (guanosine(2251)-2'-O)-methyltransferase RlmB [Gammaproteobacteria bacterium]
MAKELVYGWHTVGALCERDPAGVTEIWVQQGRHDPRSERVLALATRYGIAVHRASTRTLDRMAGGAHHQGVVAAYRAVSSGAPAPDLQEVLAKAPGPVLLLVLDGVQDPHNLGACLRTADAAGVNAVVIPRHRAANLTPGARKVAAGAAGSVPLHRVTNLARTLGELRAAGVRVVGAADDAADSLYEADLSGPIALVLGGEERGLRRLTREQCGALVRIPTAARTPTLNVSVAAGVCLFEALRQRRRL